MYIYGGLENNNKKIEGGWSRLFKWFIGRNIQKHFRTGCPGVSRKGSTSGWERRRRRRKYGKAPIGSQEILRWRGKKNLNKKIEEKSSHGYKVAILEKSPFDKSGQAIQLGYFYFLMERSSETPVVNTMETRVGGPQSENGTLHAHPAYLFLICIHILWIYCPMLIALHIFQTTLHIAASILIFIDLYLYTFPEPPPLFLSCNPISS